MSLVVVKDNPFAAGARVVSLAEGLTLAAMVDACLTDPVLRERAVVIVAGEVVPRAMWARVKPKAGTHLSVCVRLSGGGGGGGKNPIAMVLSIAVIAMAAYFAPMLAAGLAQSIGAGTAIAAGPGAIGFAASTSFLAVATPLIQAGLAVAGSLLVSALVPPSSQSMGTLSGYAGSASESATLSITGASNAANPYGVVPRVYGRHKIKPPYAAQAYTALEGDDQYLYCLFDFGYGPLALSDLRIGELPLGEFEGVETVVHPRWTAGDALSLYRNDVDAEGFNLALTAAGGPQVVESKAGADEIRLDLAFQGLTFYTDEGERARQYVSFLVEYRPADGSGGWVAVPDGAEEYHTFSAFTAQMLRRSITIRPPHRGKWSVRITRITIDATSDRVHDASTLVGVVSITFRPPVAFAEPHTLLEMRIKATNQLSGVIQDFSAVATSILPVWTGSAWTEQETRNPAWIYADILRGTANRFPRADSRLDLQGLREWAQACDAPAPQSTLPTAVVGAAADPMWTCDIVVDYATTVAALLADVAACGRAARAMPDGRFGVVRDIAQTVPVQLFTPRNSWGFRGRRIFSDQPDAFRVRFISPAAEWEQDELTVFADGMTAATAERYETLELRGCTRPAQAWREGRYHMAVARLRAETFEIQTDIENLVCTRGDLVEVAHDVPMLGGVATRVKALESNGGGQVVAVTVDEVIGHPAGVAMAARVRQAGGVLAWHTLVPAEADTETQTVRLAVPVAPADAPAVGDLMVIGEPSQATASMIVKEIYPGPDLTARLLLVDAAPAIHLADRQAIPPYTPQISTRTKIIPAAVQGLTARVISAVQGGRYIYGIGLSWRGTGLFEVYRREGDRWQLQATTYTPSYEFPDLSRGETVEYAVVAVSSQGARLPLTMAAQGSLAAYDASLVPTDVGGFGLTILGDRARLSWQVTSSTVATWWRVRWSPQTTGATWGSAVDVAARVAYPTTSVEVPARVGTYLIKGVDAYGQESAHTAEAITTIPGIAAYNVVETLAEGPVFAGVMDSVFPGAGGLQLAGVDWVDDWPDWDAVFAVDIGPGGVVSHGVYTLADVIDLGAAAGVRITAALAVAGADILQDMDAWPAVDARESWDGDDPSTYDAQLEISTTDGDPGDLDAWGGWVPLTVGDYRARAYRFRLVLSSSRVEVTPVVSSLSLTIDMPDRVQGEDNLACPEGGRMVNFPQSFHALKALAVTGDALSSGDRVEITGRSGTGFVVQFFDAAGQSVARQFDYLAKGY